MLKLPLASEFIEKIHIDKTDVILKPEKQALKQANNDSCSYRRFCTPRKCDRRKSDGKMKSSRRFVVQFRFVVVIDDTMPNNVRQQVENRIQNS